MVAWFHAWEAISFGEVLPQHRTPLGGRCYLLLQTPVEANEAVASGRHPTASLRGLILRVWQTF